RLPERLARPVVRARDRCVPRRAGVRRRHAGTTRLRRRDGAPVARLLRPPVPARGKADGVPIGPGGVGRDALSMRAARAVAGAKAEALAADYLAARGMTILERNFRR